MRYSRLATGKAKPQTFEFNFNIPISTRLRAPSYCDSHGNCLPPVFGSSIPFISYSISFLLFLLFSLDSLQPDTIQEKIQVVTFSINNLAVRVLALVLSLSFLGKLSIRV